ncbi:MAG: acyltransferase family protein [Anaerolineales bacterium]
MNANIKKDRLLWVEWIKALALLWIFINHLSELYFGYPFVANPDVNWPPFSERLAQLLPLTSYGIWNIPANLLRYLGWFGDQGVQLFLIASGFGLTWGLLSRGVNSSISYKEFLQKRAARLYPLWWGVHAIFITTWLLTGWGLSLVDKNLYLSLLGLRITPESFYYFSPAWWYFGLILQLYLVFPLLWEGLRRLGPSRLLILTVVISLSIRALGLFTFTEYLDVWQRGGIFITRLPEFVFGMSFAAWLYQNPEQLSRRLRSVWTVLLSILAYAAGIAASLTLGGMIVAPFVLGVSVFILLYLVLEKIVPRLPSWLSESGNWVGQHSYSLYLVHHPVILRLVSMGALLTISTMVRSAAALVLTVILALLLEWGVEKVSALLGKQIKTTGLFKTIFRVAVVGVSFVALLILGELAVRRFDPQEIFGWGERASLEIDDQFGWKLTPSKETHLRWLSYDYMMKANSLGFPGPDFPMEKPAGTYRVLVTGDAFSSAEGVNTDQAWPRLLQTDLGSNVEVMNFAMTGYGPSQYARIVEKFTPVYKPDLIIVEVFVNDFFDAQMTDEQFQTSIGFFEPDQNGLYSIVRLENLRQYLRLDVAEPLGEMLLNKPRALGYFLGNFASFEKDMEPTISAGAQQMDEKLAQVQDVAEQNNAKVVVVMVPASIQVCKPDQLKYYPKNIDFGDSERFDQEMPQRLVSQITDKLGVPFVDLRNAFNTEQGCSYQSRNMHWTVTGHQLVAEYIASVLKQDKFIP